MAPWKKLLPKSANFGKYEKEEKQKYKQYVKIEAQNAQLRSKPESEVYEDFLLLRSKSSRRSSKKRKAPAPQNIENAYEVLEDQNFPSNVVVINDDLRDRFAGYEPPKLQDNVYVVVQNYQDEVKKPSRLRWKKNSPTPQENPPPPPPQPPIGEAQRRNADSKPSKSEDDTHPSMSEMYFDCEEYLEIPSLVGIEDPKSRKANLITAGTFDVTDGPPNPATAKTNSTKTDPIYDDPSEASPPQSYDVEYEYVIEDEGYCENRRVYSNEPEDESRWQPSNVRFLEMSGDEEEQQIYGPYGTFEVTNYENTLNSRIQMVLEAERNSVMRSLEDQRNEEARNNVEEAEGEEIFGIYLGTHQDDFGVVDFEGYDEEFSLAQAKNIILIEAHEEEAERKKNDSTLDSSTDPFKFPSPDQFSSRLSDDFTAKPIPSDLPEDPKRNEDSSSHKHSVTTGPFDFTAENTERHLNEPTPSNLHEEIHEANNVVEPVPFNMQEEILEESKRDKGSLFKHFDHQLDEVAPSNLREEVHEEPQKAKTVDLDLKKTPPSTLRKGALKVDESPNKYVPAHSPEEENGHIKKSPKLEAITRKFEKPSSLQHSMSLTEPTEKPKPIFATFPRNVVEPVPSNMHEEIFEESKRDEGGSLFKHFDHQLNEVTPSNLREEDHEEPQKAKTVDLDLKKTPPPSTLRKYAFHRKSDKAIAESDETKNVVMGQKEILPSLEKRDVQQAETEVRINSHPHEKEEKNRITQKETSPPLRQKKSPQAEAETKEDSQPSSLDLFDKYSAFLNDPKLTMGPRSKLRSSETEQNNPNGEAFNEDNYENLQFDLSTKAKEKAPLRLKKSLQYTPNNQKKPLAQPRLSLFELKPSRNIIRSTRSNDEPEDSQLDGQRANTDLFNGLPVESEDRRVILKEQNKENTREPKITTTGPFNGLSLRSRTDVNNGIHQNGNLKIPWENETSSVGDDAITPSGNLKEEGSQSKFSKIPWRTRPKTYPNDENIFANFSSSKQEEGQNEILKIPWETKPKMSPIDRNNVTFFSKSETFEKDFVPPRKLFGQAQKNPIYDTSHELFNPHDVQSSPNITDENEKDRGNFKVFWDTTPAFLEGENPETKPKMLEQNKTGYGDISNLNFDGGGIIPRKSNEDSLEKTSDKLDRTGPRFEENFQIVNDKDIIRETFSPLNKSDKIWAEPRELGDNSSKPQDHAPWTSNSIDEDNLNDLPQDQTINTDKEDEMEKLETQNEANILEENYRILRGFNVVKEEGVIYQNIDEISAPDPVPSQLSIDKTRITKKVSFKVSEVDENPNKYVPAHSPKEENGHIKKSPKLEAISRKFEKPPSLQHSMSLTQPTEKPKPIFSTFPRRNQSTSKSDDLERLRQVLSGISDLTSVHEQINAMEYVFNKVKERMNRLEQSGYQDEYSELLHIMFRSVRIATVLECGFDPVLLDRQQTLLDDIKNSIATLNSK